MKIERVEVFGVAVPLIGEYKNAYISKSIQKSAIVRITATGDYYIGVSSEFNLVLERWPEAAKNPLGRRYWYVGF